VQDRAEPRLCWFYNGIGLKAPCLLAPGAWGLKIAIPCGLRAWSLTDSQFSFQLDDADCRHRLPRAKGGERVEFLAYDIVQTSILVIGIAAWVFDLGMRMNPEWVSVCGSFQDIDRTISSFAVGMARDKVRPQQQRSSCSSNKDCRRFEHNSQQMESS